MRVKELLQTSIAEEIRLLRHLATRLDLDRLDYRPTPGQRSTLELVRYLAACGIGPARALTEGDWELSRAEQAAVAELAAEDFAAALERQGERLQELLDDLPDEQLEEGTVTLPWSPKPMNLGRAILEMPVKFLAAYRMQLFLYLKASGQEELTTPDLWLGRTPDAG